MPIITYLLIDELTDAHYFYCPFIELENHRFALNNDLIQQFWTKKKNKQPLKSYNYD